MVPTHHPSWKSPSRRRSTSTRRINQRSSERTTREPFTPQVPLTRIDEQGKRKANKTHRKNQNKTNKGEAACLREDKRQAKRDQRRLTLGRVFNAFSAFAATKALTTLASFLGALLRKCLRRESSRRTSLNSRERRSMARRIAAVGAASGCQRPPPVCFSRFCQLKRLRA